MNDFDLHRRLVELAETDSDRAARLSQVHRLIARSRRRRSAGRIGLVSTAAVSVGGLLALRHSAPEPLQSSAPPTARGTSVPRSLPSCASQLAIATLPA